MTDKPPCTCRDTPGWAERYPNLRRDPDEHHLNCPVVNERLFAATGPDHPMWKSSVRTERDELSAKLDELCNSIAAAVGCPQWDYPGQLVRDVEALAAESCVRGDAVAALECQVEELQRVAVEQQSKYDEAMHELMAATRAYDLLEVKLRCADELAVALRAQVASLRAELRVNELLDATSGTR